MNRQIVALLVLLLTWRTGHGSTATCQANQLSAAAALCGEVLQCEGTYTTNSLKKSAGTKREKCFARAKAEFVRAYSRSLAKEARRGGECLLDDDANAISQDWQGQLVASGGLSSLILQGWDSSLRPSRKLYSGLLGAAAVDCSRLLKAHSDNAKKPNPNRLARNLKRERNKFVAAANRQIKLAKAKHLDYQGRETSAMADFIEGFVNKVVEKTKNVALPATAQQITAGDEHGCALLDNGHLKCWGRGAWGQLGLEDQNSRGDIPGEMGDQLPAINLGTGRSAMEIRAGREYSCARLDNGQVKCWGNSTAGALGLGDTNDRGDQAGEMGDDLPAVELGTGRTASGIAAGWAHTCAVLDNGQVRCWGWNGLGQLGVGDRQDRGDAPGEMGDNLPVADLGAGQRAVQVVAGWQEHTCARLENGQVKCWGHNSSGQLGLGDTDVRGDDPNEMGDNLPAVDLGSGRVARDIAAGLDYSCAVLDNGQVKCWGGAGNGQLGVADPPNNRGDDPGEMGDNLPAVDLGTGRSAVQITAGNWHTCARLDNGQVKCWGTNERGQLGLGDENDRGDQPGEMGDNLPAVDLGIGRTAVEIVAGPTSTCARLDNGDAKCWGYNFYGGLGLGDTNSRGDGPGEMGDNLPAIDFGAK